MNGSKPLISFQPEDLRFQVELEKQTYCDLKILNNIENRVAFKVKTTSPKKYFVRPNTGLIHPYESCIVRVTLQAQREFSPDMLCKDKFLLQSTVVPSNSDNDSLLANMFNKESGRVIEEYKLRVVYLSPNSVEDDDPKSTAKLSLHEKLRARVTLTGGRLFGTLSNIVDAIVKNHKKSCGKRIKDQESNIDDNPQLRHMKEQRDAAVRQTHQLQRELDTLKGNRHHKGNQGLSIRFAVLVVLIGVMLGFLLKYSYFLSSVV